MLKRENKVDTCVLHKKLIETLLMQGLVVTEADIDKCITDLEEKGFVQLNNGGAEVQFLAA